MSIDENPHPNKQYVNGLIIDMIESGQTRRVLARSAPVPSLPNIPVSPPVWAHIRNRLKVMCEIDHLVPLDRPTTAQFKIVYVQESASEDLCHYYVVKVLFDDGALDPSLSIQLELESTVRQPSSLKG